MIRPIIKYGHPVLRKKGHPVAAITPQIRQLISDMFETMRVAKGIGLAAQQVGEALQLAVFDLREVTDRPSTLLLEGQPADVNSIMPLVLINPHLKPAADPVSGAEGCLSFPEIFAEISRPESVMVNALNAEGKRLAFRCGGLLAKAIQHEQDHLNGILFIDRMLRDEKLELQPKLDELLAATKESLKKAG